MSADASPLPIGRPVRRRREVRVLAVAVLAVVGVWLSLRPHLSYYNVASGSMEPTLPVGDRVAVNRSSGAPQVGDIVVFHAPGGADPATPVCGADAQGAGYPQPCGVSTPQRSGTTLLKRVIAGPGDLISIVDGHAVRNGTAEHEPYIASCGDASRCSFPTPVKVPVGSYFVLGDNRGASDDSRFWGPVPGSWIIGTVVRCSLLGALCHPAR
jgi:signal peptidase I